MSRLIHLSKFSMILWTIFFLNCTHTQKQKISELNDDQKKDLYSFIDSEVRKQNANELKECNCMKAFFRNLSKFPDKSSRYIFDGLVGKHALIRADNRNSVDLLIIGSGTLLNELTAIANILARGKNLNLYLTDWAYIFYEDPDFEEKAINFGKNPDQIPDGWKGFYFWDWYRSGKKPYLPFFKTHHVAIDQFKAVIAKLDQNFGTQTTVHIINPPIDKKMKLPHLDMIISIDAFIDIPNLFWNLYYQMETTNTPIRYLALNKSKPLGGFWDSTNLAKKEEYSLNQVSIDVYDIIGGQNHGSYQLIENHTFEKNDYQIKHAPNFTVNPEQDATQGIFDIKG